MSKAPRKTANELILGKFGLHLTLLDFEDSLSLASTENFYIIINIIRINSHCGFRAPHPPRCARRAPHPLLRRLCLTSVPAVPPLCAGCAAPLCRLCRPSAPAVPPAVPAVPPAVPAVPPAAPAVPPRCAGSAI